ncbi:MAG: hypothetical protein K0S65_335 [Labilithrix sp.]|nr:hypothetical protein [Labilithrix sp.]
MRRLIPRRVAGSWLLRLAASSALLLACNLGDDYYPSPGGFGGIPGRGPVFDAGSADTPRTCDGAREGSACFNSSTRASFTGSCEDKKLANPACNATLRCLGNEWTRGVPQRSACATGCPAAYVAEMPDGSCAIPRANTLICEYPEGTCGCAPVRAVDWDAGDGGSGEPDEDAGESDAGDAGPTAYEWRCVTPAAGCPRKRPRIGDDCVLPMSCDYGDCLFDDGVTMHCYDQHWRADRRCDR